MIDSYSFDTQRQRQKSSFLANSKYFFSKFLALTAPLPPQDYSKYD